MTVIDFEDKNSYLVNMKSRMTERGQVTIPKALRETLGLREGDELEFEEREGAIFVRRIQRSDPLQELRGLLGSQLDVDGFLAETRGGAWESAEDGGAG